MLDCVGGTSCLKLLKLVTLGRLESGWPLVMTSSGLR